MVSKKTIYGYFGQHDNQFIKITVSLPKYVAKARGVLESGTFSMPDFQSLTLAPFESNLAYTMRFMIDCGVRLYHYDYIVLILGHGSKLD